MDIRLRMTKIYFFTEDIVSHRQSGEDNKWRGCAFIM